MLFSSITFLYIFLPITLAAYFVAPKKLRNIVLLLASLIFYFCGEPKYVLLLVFSSVSDWLHSLFIEKYRGDKKAKALLISSITINLLMLGFFKYSDFLIGAFNGITGASIPLTNVPLPIGISFYTFQTMSYTIDVYRGKAHAERSLLSFATFVCLFPQLIAGPIVRYTDISNELENRWKSYSIHDAGTGVRRFIIGLGKKVLLANAFGEVCAAFKATSEPSVLYAWIYALSFMLQVYFDFSSYSDMAIGLGRMLGFVFPENFNYPYISKSVSEFWRRWHITLGSWFRDYVYIPLGGNRVSKFKLIRNITVVWCLTGLWHGAAWNFVVWGAYYAILLTLEKLFLGKWLERAGAFAAHAYTVFAVMISFVIFNADSLLGALCDIAMMFGANNVPLISQEALYNLKSYALPLAIGIFGALPTVRRLWQRADASVLGRKWLTVLEPAGIALILIASTAYIIDGSFNPFLYFRF